MARYRAVRVSVDHPLARLNASLSADGSTVQVWEHRLVLFDKIGAGPHLCHWCGRALNWAVGRGPGGSDLVTDHIDHDQRNNEPANLVPSCQGCNAHRDRRIPDGDLFVIRQGKRHRAERRICQHCRDLFLVEVAALKQAERTGKNVGRFCSMPCMWAGR